MKNKTLTIITSSALAMVLAVAPAAAFAKSGGESEKNLHARVEAEASRKADKSCLKAFGHLVAPGWISANGTTTVDSTCELPFGISKKLGFEKKHGKGTKATTTPDTTAPVISRIASRTSATSAVVVWHTNERTDTKVTYGTTTAYDSTANGKNARHSFHSVKITGLLPATTYHFQISSTDKSGNVTVSADSTFTTKPAPDTTAPTLGTVSVSGIGSTAATVNWTTNEPSTSKVYFASGSSLDLNTATAVKSSALVNTHAVTLTGLSASTTYSYAVQSKDASGNGSTSVVGSFVTGL